jgi:ADP-heptose:LPS heptosyltransferase
MPQTPRNLLAFKIGQIGDTVAAVPSLWVLRRQFPDARIHLLSEKSRRKNHQPPEMVLPAAGLVDGFEKYPGGAPSLRNYFAVFLQVRRLRRRGFNTLVYLLPSDRTRKQRIRDRVFFRAAGIATSFGFDGYHDNLRARDSNGSLISLPNEADALLDRLRVGGLAVPAPGQGCMDLQLTPAERQRASDWLRDNGGPNARNLVAVCPGAKVTSKLWPWERYRDVMRLLIKQHALFPVIIGGDDERKVGLRLLSEWRVGLCAAGELTIRESAALMETARFYLGNDTGAMHLAAAVGLLCVAIFSAREWPGRWYPYGEGHKVMSFDVPCAGCRLEVCDKELQCLQGIQVGQVYQACVEVLNSPKSRK